MSDYFSGQGKLFIATRDGSGNPGAFRFVGNVKDLKFSLATSTLEHKESQSGQRLTDKRLVTEKKTSIDGVLEELNLDNLALALYGTKATHSASTVTAEVAPTGLVVGDYYRTLYPKISNVVVKDSAGSPATLVLNTDYSIESANHGTIKILNLGSYTQPFKTDYSHAAHTYVPMFNAAPPERWLRFEGINTAESNKPVLIEFYRTLLDPLKELALINDDFAGLSISGSALYDDTKTNDAVLGLFGHYLDLS